MWANDDGDNSSLSSCGTLCLPKGGTASAGEMEGRWAAAPSLLCPPWAAPWLRAVYLVMLGVITGTAMCSNSFLGVEMKSR